MKIHVTDMFNMSIHQLSDIPAEQLLVMFDDGVELPCSKRTCIYSWYFWEIHRHYPTTPILHTHHVNHILKGKLLTSSTHIQLLEIIFNDVVEVYKLYLPKEKEPLLKLVYKVTNTLYNEVTKLAEEYVNSIDILDFVEVVEHPVIKNAIINVDPNPQSISDCYGEVVNSLMEDVVLKNNSLVHAIRTNIVDIKQVLQCVSIRGFVAEVDGSILSTPILTNYTKGLVKLYDYVADSRSAARALYFSEAPLQDAEYFARRLQLLSMVVESIAPGDCGSHKYVPWRVAGRSHNEAGDVVYNGDLNYMLGKYYTMDPNDHNLKVITKDDCDLHGELLYLRTSLYCEHPDPHKICSVCFGDLSKNVNAYVNLGHLCSATMTQQTSQSVLSTKHLLASSVSPDIILSDTAKRYFVVNSTRNSYLVRKELKDQEVKLVVNRDEAAGLIDVINIQDIANINPTRISYISAIEIQYRDKFEEHMVPIEVAQGNRKAMLTIEFLKYLKVHGWETDIRNNFTFDLSKWDFKLPILKLPDMEYSFSDHSGQIAKVIESSMKNITERANPNSPVTTLQELFSLVNTKLSVNIAALEVILYAAMLPSKDDYRMARGAPEPILGIVDLIIKNRSMSASMAFEGQNASICNPRSYFNLNRPSHVLDYALTPNEVMHDPSVNHTH